MADSFKLLAVLPHPDDETLGMGATVARYAAEGIAVYLVCATRGERGWFDSEALAFDVAVLLAEQNARFTERVADRGYRLEKGKISPA